MAQVVRSCPGLCSLNIDPDASEAKLALQSQADIEEVKLASILLKSGSVISLQPT